MNAHHKEDSCGAWKQETLDSVARVLADDFKANAGKNTSLTPKDVMARVKAALTKGMVEEPRPRGGTKKKVPDYGDNDKPRAVKDEDWAPLRVLLNKCVKMRMTEWPWGNDATVAIDGRAYHESYPGEWVSYSCAERAKLEVRDYQWRAPPEWFAELYAFSWYHDDWKPPGPIPAGVLKYLRQKPAN